jgi:AcrR family transcriptional regulator
MTAESVTQHDGAEQPRRRPGRPRSAPRSRPDTSTREEILDAAARLFAKQGYEGTTTRQIAELVGIKQASLYYHFSDKSSIVLALLDGTVSPSVAFSDWVLALDVSPEVKLFSLARFDLEVILSDPWNMHVLFRIPDIAASDAAGAREELSALQERYIALSRQCAARFDALAGRDPVQESDFVLVFGLVEGIIAQRYWGSLEARAAYAETVPRGCLRLLRVPETAIAEAALSAGEVIARYRSLEPR